MTTTWIDNPGGALKERATELQFWQSALQRFWERAGFKEPTDVAGNLGMLLIDLGQSSQVRLGYAALRLLEARMRYNDLASAIKWRSPAKEYDVGGALEYPFEHTDVGEVVRGAARVVAKDLYAKDNRLTSADEVIDCLYQYRLMAALDSTTVDILQAKVRSGLRTLDQQQHNYVKAHLRNYILGEGILSWIPDQAGVDFQSRYPMLYEILSKEEREMSDKAIDDAIDQADIDYDTISIVKDVLSRIIRSLDMDWDRVWDLDDEGLVGSGIGGGHAINMIPSRRQGKCNKVLLVMSHHHRLPLKKALDKMVAHLVLCAETTTVIVVTDSWNEKDLTQSETTRGAFAARNGRIVWMFANNHRLHPVSPA